jgi:hypothetical protein
VPSILLLVSSSETTCSISTSPMGRMGGVLMGECAKYEAGDRDLVNDSAGSSSDDVGVKDRLIESASSSSDA